MDLSQKIDLVVVVIANLLNLILSLIFLNRVFGRTEWEHWLGYGTLIMVFPLTSIVLANLVGRRDWAFWVLFYFCLISPISKRKLLSVGL